MTIRRLGAILIIFLGASLAWSLLGKALTHRSTTFGERLGDEVAQNWGAPMVQGHPTIHYESTGGIAARRAVLPESSDLALNLHYDKKRKGLYWYRTYTADFQGDYVVKNNDVRIRDVMCNLLHVLCDSLSDSDLSVSYCAMCLLFFVFCGHFRLIGLQHT